MADPPVRVLYVAGWGRNGSTLTGSILGQLPRFAFIGELANIWRLDQPEAPRRCGCGRPFRACPLWSAVLARAFGARLDAAVGELHELVAGATRTRHMGAVLTGRLGPRARRLADHLAPLYRAIAAETGAEVLVDTSKNPAYARVLSGTFGVELRMVHLVRDPRAVAHSWRRRKPTLDGDPGTELPRIPAAESALIWNAWSLAADRLANRLGDRGARIRYEDLVERPEPALMRLRELAGGAGPLPLEGRTVRLDPAHSLLGNPVRFAGSSLELRPDRAWRDEMPRNDRLLVGALTLPLRRRYGYR